MTPALRTVSMGLAAAAVVAVPMALAPSVVITARLQVTGWISQLRNPPAGGQAAVVDIDAAAVAREGPWPWPRATTARLVEAIAAARPKVLAIDIVLAGRCGADDPGNAALAAAIGSLPATLGFVMPGPDAAPPRKAAIAVRHPVNLPELWRSAGAETPCAEFIATAQGLGLLSLAGGGSATVTSVPGLAVAGTTAFPGLAVDAARLAGGTATLLATGAPDTELVARNFAAPLDAAGETVLHATGPDVWGPRTFSAASVLEGKAAALEGRIVILGSSLPQAGALRPTMADPLTPSAQIHADFVEGLLTGSLPHRPSAIVWIELLSLAFGTLATVVASLRLRPAFTASLTLGMMAAVLAAAVFAYHILRLTFDPLFPMSGILAAGLVAGLSQYSATRTGAAALRRSFEQRLPPAVVARLSEAGAGGRLGGEERVVTAVFTDIEGFSVMTTKAGSRELVRLLDGYFEGVSGIVTAHGGMIDKIVGDAVHAFFNMPLELESHEGKALDCAAAILAFSEDYRARPDALAAGFGRTRIGVETGLALVGDVGAGGKLDYSAHGPAVNLAARLQEANKLTGTAILAGPGLKAAAPPGWRFESRGTHDLRGFGPTEVFTPTKAP